MADKISNPLTEEELAAVHKSVADFGSDVHKPLPETPQKSKTESSGKSKAIRKHKAWIIYLSVVLIIALGLGIGYVIWANQIENHPNCMTKRKSTITAGNNSFAAIQNGGSVFFDSFNFLFDEDQWTNMVSIDMGIKHIVGLRKDGTVVFAGSNNGSECMQWKNVTVLSAGSNHTAGLCSDGTVLAAGDNDYGQCNVQKWKDIIGIDASSVFTAGLCSDGTVVVTQLLSGSGIIEENTFTRLSTALKSVGEWRDIVAISASGLNLVGLKRDGTVVAVGENEYGQCNVSSWTDIASIYTCDTLTIGIREDGSAVIAGLLPGAYATEPQALYNDFSALTADMRIVAACCSISKAYLLCEDGTVYRLVFNIATSALTCAEHTTGVKLPK